MTTIRREILLSASPDDVWDVVRDVGAVHTRFAPGFVVDTKMVDGPARIVTFANGVVARELIVGVDQDVRRLAYSVTDGAATHHNASFQVVANGPGAKLIWITDVLPDSIAPRFEAMIDQGVRAIQGALGA